MGVHETCVCENVLLQCVRAHVKQWHAGGRAASRQNRRTMPSEGQLWSRNPKHDTAPRGCSHIHPGTNTQRANDTVPIRLCAASAHASAHARAGVALPRTAAMEVRFIVAPLGAAVREGTTLMY